MFECVSTVCHSSHQGAKQNFQASLEQLLPPVVLLGRSIELSCQKERMEPSQLAPGRRHHRYHHPLRPLSQVST